MAIDQEDQDKSDDIEISKEKDKQEQLQKIKEDADLWEERRNKLRDKAMEISADPQAWLKGFLMKGQRKLVITLYQKREDLRLLLLKKKKRQSVKRIILIS